MDYQKPFSVHDGVITDKNGHPVRLFGVNYYMPFNHNYVNIHEIGRDPFRAIDRDLHDLRTLGVDFLRLHLFDREISDMDGTLIENEHLRLLDYLIDRAAQMGFFMMITGMAWWNSVEVQTRVTERYAYWTIGDNQAFGFSNFLPKYCMIWHEELMQAQERYLDGLFSHKNAFSGLTMAEYGHIVAIEVLNEPEYPTIRHIRALQHAAPQKSTTLLGREELRLLARYGEWLDGKPDTDDNAHDFCVCLIDRYIRRMFSLVDKYFNGQVLKTHIYYGYEDPAIGALLRQAPIDCISVAGYCEGSFDSAHVTRNLLPDAKAWLKRFSPLRDLGKGLIAYEFNFQSTLQGYSLPAIACAMAALGVQMAAYFTYTPVDLGEYNPGWLVHPLNLYYTPSRAASFTAAGLVFRAMRAGDPLPDGEESWQTGALMVDSRTDAVVWQKDGLFLHSAEYDGEIPPETNRLVGRFSSPWIRYDGNGLYELSLDGLSARLTVRPDCAILSDPFRGKAFSHMANRYVNVNRESAVFRLREGGHPMTVTIPGLCLIRVWDERGSIPVAEGTFQAAPGEYLLSFEPA